MIQVEQYAFDHDVFLIVQEHGKYNDFKVGVSDAKTKIYGVRFSQRFFIPAEYDIILAYEPTYRANGIVSDGGKIRFKTLLQRYLTDSDLLATNTKILQRPTTTESEKDTESDTSQDTSEDTSQDTEQSPDSNTEQPDTKPKEEEKETVDDRGVIVIDPADEPEPTERVNWDGEAVSDGPWLQREVLTINDTPITN